MKMKEFFRAVKYTVVAASAGIIQMGSFAFLSKVVFKVEEGEFDFGLPHFIALVLSVLWNFTINRKATFKSNANYGIAMLKVIGYYCVYTPFSIFFGRWLYYDNHWNMFVIEVLLLFINFITEFAFMTFVVFRGKTDTAEKKQVKEENNGQDKVETQEIVE